MITKRKSGWESTAYGQRFDHYFKENSTRPICNSTAIFCVPVERRDKPRGYTCKKCTELRQEQENKE